MATGSKPNPSPSWHSSSYRRRHPEAPTISNAVAVPGATSVLPAKDRLSISDSLTLLGIVLGVLLVLIVPPLIVKIILLVAVSCGSLWLVGKSVWSHDWTIKTKAITAIVVVVLLWGIGIPQLYSQWRLGHPTTLKVDPTVKPAPAPTGVQPSALDAARRRFKDDPDGLTLQDLFFIDSGAAQQSSIGSMFLDDTQTIKVGYSINTDLAARSKFLSFYIPNQPQHTEEICKYLVDKYKVVLDKAPQLLVDQKGIGDSATTSTKEAVFSRRIYVYHETYLPAETTVKLGKLYKNQGISGIFRSTDYLATKRQEATIQKLRRRID